MYRGPIVILRNSQSTEHEGVVIKHVLYNADSMDFIRARRVCGEGHGTAPTMAAK